MVIPEARGALEEEVVGRIEDLLILVLYVSHYCGKTGHIAAQCYAKRDDIRSGKLPQGNYASSSRHDEDRKEHLFVM